MPGRSFTSTTRSGISTGSPVYSVHRETVEDGRPVTDTAWEDSDFRGVDAPQAGDRTLSTCSYAFSDARYVVAGTVKKQRQKPPAMATSSAVFVWSVYLWRKISLSGC